MKHSLLFVLATLAFSEIAALPQKNGYSIVQPSGGKSANSTPRKTVHTKQKLKVSAVRKATNSASPRISRLPTVVELLRQYPDAVSIAMRFSKQTDFDSALQFYQSVVPNTDTVVNDNSVSFVLTKDIDRTHDIELLLVSYNGSKKSDVIIGYKALNASITDTVSMKKEYDRLIKNSGGHFKRLEEPGYSLRGSRDDKKPEKAYRAVYEKVNTSLSRPGSKSFPGSSTIFSEVYEGIIINPPVP